MDHQEFKQAVDRYADMVLRIALHNVSNQADAQDVSQDVFIALLRQKAFSMEEHLKAWLIRATINRSRDYIRRSQVRRTAPLSDNLADLTAQDHHLLEEVRSLPRDARNVIYLHYYEGYTTREVARMLGMKEGTVSSHLSRGKQQLRMKLEEGGNHVSV